MVEHIVLVDASEYAIAGIMHQIQPDDHGNPTKVVFEYFSRKLLPAQTRYTATKRECLAIVVSVKPHWRHFLDTYF